MWVSVDELLQKAVHVYNEGVKVGTTNSRGGGVVSFGLRGTKLPA
jgi:hypothetical protein